MLPAYRPVTPVVDATLQRVQQAIQRALVRVTGCPILDGNMLTATFTASVNQSIAHKLGRPALGFFVAGLSSPARITRATGAMESTLITLQSDAATTATLWVF